MPLRCCVSLALVRAHAAVPVVPVLQVLLCKLIDLLDDAVPWEDQPYFNPGEQPVFIQRDIR